MRSKTHSESVALQRPETPLLAVISFCEDIGAALRRDAFALDRTPRPAQANALNDHYLRR